MTLSFRAGLEVYLSFVAWLPRRISPTASELRRTDMGAIGGEAGIVHVTNVGTVPAGKGVSIVGGNTNTVDRILKRTMTTMMTITIMPHTVVKAISTRNTTS